MANHPSDNPGCCTTPDCCGSPSRRDFLQTVGLGGVAALASALPAVAGPFEKADFDKLIPADKKLQANWLKSLVARGAPTVYRGAELDKIGMPVGGIAAGQLYLGGDGKLWHWDLFNLPQSGNFTSGGGPNFARPPKPASPLEQGFALQVIADGKTQLRCSTSAASRTSPSAVSTRWASWTTATRIFRSRSPSKPSRRSSP